MGTLANLYIDTALIDASSRIMGLDLVYSGYVPHSCLTSKGNVCEIAHGFESAP